ncbi:MAG: hypothetical protein HFJ29_04060 [Clostridia bacterium]|nr:hypothetical protein [Clostridia bacterium]
MLLGIAGVTGTGKSYYKDKLVERLGFEKLKIITTREMRKGEKNNEDKIFVSEEELQNLRSEGQIAYEFELLGYKYAYTKKELFSDKNMVFEVHYNTIYEFKKVCPNMKVLYLFPQDIEIAKQKTRERGLTPEVEKKRLLEIDEHYERVKKDTDLRNMFDYIQYNNYDQESEHRIVDFIQKVILEEKDMK